MLIRKLLGRSAKSIAILRHNSSGFLNPRRFYKEVTVNPIENKYEIFLDARKLKTPKGNQLIVSLFVIHLPVQTNKLTLKEQ
jgi:chaperone required for assembly of F1-ATPase